MKINLSFLKIIIATLLSTLLLSSCNNMSNQDVGTLSGGLAGGLLGSTLGNGSGKMVAVAAGTLVGAYLGGSIGQNMDRNDRARVNQALDTNPTGEPAYWRNANTQASYQVVPTRNVTVGDNQYCREYQTIANINGKRQKMYGTACRQPDGSWTPANN